MDTDAITDVVHEREFQIAKWGGAAHDDQHGANDWVALLIERIGMTVPFAWQGEWEAWRAYMVQVAALAVAAVEWADRRQDKGEGPSDA